MRFSVLVVVIFFGYAQPLRFSNAKDLENIYARLLDRIINFLDDLVKQTDDPSPEDKDRLSCVYGLNALARNLGSSWGLTMIDSASKLPSGILNGNLMDLGHYDECVGVSVQPTPEDPQLPTFTGQHCLVGYNIFVPNHTIVINGEKRDLIDLFGSPYIPLTMAYCYPSLCKPWVLQEALNKVFSLPDNFFPILGLDYRLNVTVDPMDCHVTDQQPLDAVDWAVMGVIIVLLVLGLVSSSVDIMYTSLHPAKRSSSFAMQLLGSFSYYTNANKIFSLRMVGDAISSLNGMKFFSMCSVILGHRYMYLLREPLTNFTDIPDDLKKISNMIILNAAVAVDTFFLTSGMLNMYGFLFLMEKRKRYTIMDVINGYIHRYLRYWLQCLINESHTLAEQGARSVHAYFWLTPAYLMMIAFTATWQYRLNDGPLWDRFVGDYKNTCRERYWVNLIYLNNYIDTDNYCMMQSWYLAADMQLYLLSPLIVYPLWKWPKFGFIELGLLIGGSIISPFLVSWYGHIAAPIPITSDHVRRAREMTMLYYPLHTKSVSYFLGIGTGYFIFKYRKGKLRMNMNIWMRAIGWMISATSMLYAIFGGYTIFQLDGEYNQLFSAFFIGFQRFFWSCGLVWIIWMCVTGYGGLINDFLSWKLFIPLGRLTYSTYLTHIVVLTCSVAIQKNSINYNDFDQVEMYLGDVLMCLFTGLILTLLIEAPMFNVEKLILGIGRNNPKPPRLETIPPPTLQEHLHVA